MAGLLGGACWLVRGFNDAEILRWLGLGLLGLALVATGAALVKAAWLRLLVGIAFPVLVWSVVEVLHDSADPADTVDAVVGGVAVLIAVVVLIRSAARPSDRERRTAGSHAR
jgi:hypothetical protein